MGVQNFTTSENGMRVLLSSLFRIDSTFPLLTQVQRVADTVKSGKGWGAQFFSLLCGNTVSLSTPSTKAFKPSGQERYGGVGHWSIHTHFISLHLISLLSHRNLTLPSNCLLPLILQTQKHTTWLDNIAKIIGEKLFSQKKKWLSSFFWKPNENSIDWR